MRTQSDGSSPLLPGWAKALAVSGVVLAIALLVVHILGVVATGRWNRYAASLRESSGALTYEEIEALRRPAVDGPSGAKVLERLAERLGQLGPYPPEVLIFGRRPSAIDFAEGLSVVRVDATRQFLDQHTEVLEDLSVIPGLPPGRWELPLDGDPIAIALPDFSWLRNAVKLVHLEGALALVDGDLERAVRAIRMQRGISATLDEHPTVIGRMVQISVDSLLVRSIENTLRTDELSREMLSRLSDDLQDRLAAGTMKWAFLGERAHFARLCEAVIAQGGSLTGAGGRTSLSWLPDFLVRRNQLRGVEMLTWLVDAGDDPSALTAAANRIDLDVPNLSATEWLVRIMMPSLSRAVELHLRITARLRSASAALAAERFRLATGSWPRSLDALVPEYLPALPVDPFDGQALRLARTEEGIVIYSVGENRTDDGGDVVRRKTKPRVFPDVGFRLVSPAHRRVLWVEEPVGEEG